MDSSGFFVTPTVNSECSNFKLLHSSKTGYNELYLVDQDGRNFVIKALKEEYRGNPIYESLLRKEFEIGYSLDNLNICHTYSYKKFDNLGNAILLEYIDGRTLDKFIEEGKHTFAELREIIFQLCTALEYAHKKQIIHRDLKPENIIITYNGDNVKLIDFGLSDTDYHSGMKIAAGTLSYASPEQKRGEQLDNRSDIYSLGIIIKYIFKGKSNLKIKRIISRCCKENANKRYYNCASLRTAFTKHDWGGAIITILSITALIAIGLAIFNNSHIVEKDPTKEVIATVDSVKVDTTNLSIEKPKTQPVTSSEEKGVKQTAPTAPKDYENLTAEFKSLHKVLDYSLADPLGKIPNFSKDSIAYVRRSHFMLDSLFSTPADRQTLEYSNLKELDFGSFYYKMYHLYYINIFFEKASDIFSAANDSYAIELRELAPTIPQDTIGATAVNAEYDYNTATIVKYIVKLRRDNGLSPLPADFLNFYENQKIR